MEGERGRHEKRRGVIVGGRGGDGLVHGQKDKGGESERGLSEGCLGMKEPADAWR